MSTSAENNSEAKPLSFFQVLGSVFSAAIGVQSKALKDRDEARGKPIHFILAGLIFTAVFVGSMIGLVNVVLSG